MGSEITGSGALPPRRSSDAGFTLAELVVAVTITGVMLSAISFALLFILNGTQRADNSISQARDVSFIQTWVPIDLASATSLDSDPTADPTSGGVLPGTNVLVIERENLLDAGQPPYYVTYRYVNDGPEWQLERYEIRNPGTAYEDVFMTGVARELAAPPTDGSWDPTLPPVHAADVGARGTSALRAAGRDLTFTFADGSTFIAGGAGPGPSVTLPGGGDGGFVDPASPRSRCGGKVTIVVDSSGSMGSNQVHANDATKSIVNDFRGTPTWMRIIDFDTYAEALVPSTWNGPPIDMLELSDAEQTSIDTAIDSMTVDGNTNWEAALRMAMTDWSTFASVDPSPHVPDLVLFVTDGDPSRYLTDDGQNLGIGNTSDPLWPSQIPLYMAETREVTEKRSEWGVQMKGIFIYPESSPAPSSESQARLKEIVGPVEWSSSAEDPVGNAAIADFFMGTAPDLSSILRQIFASNCGGTVTVQKRVVNGGVEVVAPSGAWTYTTSDGTRTLDAALLPTITFDHDLGGTGAWVPLIEEPVAGRTLTDVRCSQRGVDVSSTHVRALVDGGMPVPNGREVFVEPNEALLCRYVSE